jgi:hypothetical protein
MSTKKKPLFEKVEKPIIERTERSSVYTSLIQSIEQQEHGWYKVNITDVKPLSVFTTLTKRLKGRKDLVPHLINKTVYIEKTS